MGRSREGRASGPVRGKQVEDEDEIHVEGNEWLIKIDGNRAENRLLRVVSNEGEKRWSGLKNDEVVSPWYTK